MPQDDAWNDLTLEERKKFWEWADEVMGLRPDFFEQLEIDGEWTFLIKWHAVLETCANRLLSQYFNDPSVNSVLGHLTMSDSRSGKIAFISACELLPKPQRTFIHKLSEMRNHAVHDIKNFGFTFAEYLERFEDKARTALIKQLGFAYENDAISKSDRTALVQIIEASPRTAISASCKRIVAEIFAWEKSRGNPDGITKVLNSLAPLFALRFPPRPYESIPTEQS